MKIQSSIKGIPEALELYGSVTKKALSRTVGDLGRRMNTAAKRAIREDYNIKLKDLKNYIKLLPFRLGDLKTTVRAWGKAIPLIRYGAKQKPQGVQVRVSRARGNVILPHTFKAMMASGHEGVFERTIAGGKRTPRLPIRELFGPAIPQLFKSHNVMTKIRAVLHDAQRLFNANLRYYVTRKGTVFKGIPGNDESEE